jgi:hypothetical protein
VVKKMSTSAIDEIFSVVRAHRGAANAIDAFDICDELGWSHGCARNVRRLIADNYRTWPEIVCARVGAPDGSGGYFIAETYAEIEAYWAHLDDFAAKQVAKANDYAEFVGSKGINLKFARKAA